MFPIQAEEVGRSYQVVEDRVIGACRLGRTHGSVLSRLTPEFLGNVVEIFQSG